MDDGPGEPPQDGGGQIDLPPLLAVVDEAPAKKWKTTPSQLEAARQTRLAAVSNRKLEAQKRKADAAIEDLHEVAASIPGAAALLGMRARPNITGRMRIFAPKDFRWLCTVVF